MKKKIKLKTLLIAGTLAVALAGCTKTKINPKTNPTTTPTTTDTTPITTGTDPIITTGTTPATTTGVEPTTTIIEDKVLVANTYYVSNNEDFIVRADTLNNKLDTFRLLSLNLDGVYVRPIIANNKFTNVSIVSDKSSLLLGTDIKYIGITNDFTSIADITMDSLSETSVTKPLAIKLSEDKIEFKFNNEIYSVNVDGSINEKVFTKLDSNVNKFINNNDEFIISSNNDVYKLSFTKDEFKKENIDYTVGIKFEDDKITKYSKSNNFDPFSNYNYEYTLDNKLKPLKLILTNESPFGGDETNNYNFSYSLDENKILLESEIDNDNGNNPFGSMSIPSTITIEFDENYKIISYINEQKIDDDFIISKRQTTITYNEDLTYNKIEVIDESFGDQETSSETFEYDSLGYLIKRISLSKRDNIIYDYIYDENHKLINCKESDENYTYKEYKLEIDNNTSTEYTYYYNTDQSIDNNTSYKLISKYDSNGNIIEKTVYVNLDSPYKKYNYSYTNDGEYFIFETIESRYDTNYSLFKDYSKTVEKTKNNQVITEEFKYDNDLEKFLIDSTIQIDKTDSYTRTTKTEYELSDDETEAIICYKTIDEIGDIYTISTKFNYNNGEISQGERITKYIYSNEEQIETYNTNTNKFQITTITKYFPDTNLSEEKTEIYYFDDGDIKQRTYHKYILNPAESKIYSSEYTNISYTDDKKEDLNSTTIYDYDNYFNMIRYESYSLRNGNFSEHEIYEGVYKNNERIRFTYSYYDENKNLTGLEMFAYVNNELKLVNNRKIINGEIKDTIRSIFNDNDTIKMMEEYKYDNSNNNISYLKITNYDDNGNYVSAIDYNYDNDGNITYQKEYVSFNNKEVVLNEYILVNEGVFAGQLMISEKYEFDEEGNPLNRTSYGYYSYSSVNQVISDFKTYENGVYVEQYYDMTYYNSNFEIISRIHYSYKDKQGVLCPTRYYSTVNGEEILTKYIAYDNNTDEYSLKVDGTLSNNKEYFKYVIVITYGDTTSVIRYQNNIENNTYTTYQLKNEYLDEEVTWKLDDYEDYYDKISDESSGIVTVEDFI